MNINDFAIQAAAQPAGRGGMPLSASMRGVGGGCLPIVSWPAAVDLVNGPRLRGRKAAFTRVQAVIAATKPGDTNIRKPYQHMTSVTAGGDGALGSHPAREPEPV